ncbi:hypothetical protein [Streptomyces sp. NPDC018584]|uniref:hypothetical protein n=1 Tax=unclassified Streptomyces TaxID=2593676 RepID=UPI0037BCFA30
MSFMSPGQVVWFEIGTTAPEAVTGFYGPLLGWTFEADPDSSIDGRRRHARRTGRHGRRAQYMQRAAPQQEGAQVEQRPRSAPDGSLRARIRDLRSNRFGLLSQPAPSTER